MRWMVLLFCLVVGLAEAKTYVPIASIQPIQRVNDDGVTVNICTSFCINEAKGLWLTANHCYAGSELFDGQPIRWVAYNERWDLAVFEGRKVAALKLAIQEPQTGDDIYLIGYPHGSLDPLTFFGKVSSPFARLTAVVSGMVFNVLGLPGDSGAPILDKSGRVVGIGQTSNQQGVTWGTPWKMLKEQTTRFWEN